MQTPRIETNSSLAENFLNIAGTVCANEQPDFNPSAKVWTWAPDEARIFASPISVQREQTIDEYSKLHVVTLSIGGDEEENMTVREDDSRALAVDAYAASFLERFTSIYMVHTHDLCLRALQDQLATRPSERNFGFVDKRGSRAYYA